MPDSIFKIKNSGFTLVELLVVISIIGLLASIVMSGLVSARLKAKDSKIIQQVQQLRTLMGLNYVDYGSFTNLQPASPGAWYGTTAECNAGFAGNYAAKAREICIIITGLSGSNFANTDGLHIGNSNTSAKYSIMAYLPGKGTFYCLGSGGRSSDTTSTAVWTAAGCRDNP